MEQQDIKQMVIRQATEQDASQIAEIIVEDWKIAYRGIIDSAFLDAMDVEERTQREAKRFQIYRVAAVGDRVLGLTWNEIAEEEASDCEIIALYVRNECRKGGIGKALFQDSVEQFLKAGKNTMIIWCLKENVEARKFYEKMGGEVYKDGTHRWGDRDYDMISYLYHLSE